jgi:prepilin signal peptidase PulO-like enzyme (type II secretory pathway)
MELSAFFTAIAGVFGAIVGSFINALSFRFNTGRSMGGRSKCMHCGHTLSVLDLIPIISFLFLRGRCRYCHSKISWQYPLVECAAAVLGALTYVSHPDPLWFFFWFVVWMVLLFVVVYDMRHTIIPWSCSVLLFVLAALYLGFAAPLLWDIYAGVILAAPLLLLSLASSGRWMGFADGLLELSLGSLLGLAIGFSALLIAFWSGAIVGSILLLLKTRYTMRSEVPFAPFLVFGAAAGHFLNVDILQTIALW